MPEPTVVDQPPELMASSIVTTSVRVRIAEAGDIHPGDDVQLTPITGPIRVLDVQDGWAPALTALVVSLPRGPQQPGGLPQQDLCGTLVVPADLEVTMLRAIREARIACLLCQRLCLWVFDYATSSSAATVVCEECDTKVTAEVEATPVTRLRKVT